MTGLLDDGPETVLVYPAVETRTDRGNIDLAPGEEPVELTGCWVTEIVPARPPTTGGVEAGLARYRLVSRSFPAGPWSRVSWRGRDLDVAVDPADRAGLPGLEHVLVILQARTPQPPAVPSG